MHTTKRCLAVVGILALISAAFLAGTLVHTAFTQSAGPQYVKIDYMKVDPYKINSYVKMEQNVWKPIHQQLVRDGKIRSWSLYEVRFPQGDSMEYGYLTFTTFDKFQDLESADNPDVFAETVKKLNPKSSTIALETQALENRRLVRSEVWKLVDSTK